MVPLPSVSTEAMSLRYAFSDDHRVTLRVWLSARNRLAAISDSLGRIILVDCSQNIILRIWKGYRDAQCSFMQVDEKLSKNTHKQKRNIQHFWPFIRREDRPLTSGVLNVVKSWPPSQLALMAN